MLCTVSDEGVYTVNCGLYILDKRNAVMQFVIDTGASITCCRAKELGIIHMSFGTRFTDAVVLSVSKRYKRTVYNR